MGENYFQFVFVKMFIVLTSPGIFFSKIFTLCCYHTSRYFKIILYHILDCRWRLSDIFRPEVESVGKINTGSGLKRTWMGNLCLTALIHCLKENWHNLIITWFVFLFFVRALGKKEKPISNGGLQAHQGSISWETSCKCKISRTLLIFLRVVVWEKHRMTYTWSGDVPHRIYYFNGEVEELSFSPQKFNAFFTMHWVSNLVFSVHRRH